MGLTALMLMYLGILYGIPRRHPSVMDIPCTEFSFAAARPLFVVLGTVPTGPVVFDFQSSLEGAGADINPDLLCTKSTGGRRCIAT